MLQTSQKVEHPQAVHQHGGSPFAFLLNQPEKDTLPPSNMEVQNPHFQEGSRGLKQMEVVEMDEFQKER